MAQDRAGLLWVATGDGLVRYDGYRFRPQERASPDPASRNLGWVRALLAGRDGRVWIGTETDGLAVHHPVTEQVTLAGPRPPAAGDGRAQVQPTILALAEAADGAIWVGTMGGGLLRHDPATGQNTHYRQGREPGSLPDDRVLALAVDRLGTLWVGTWQGLSRRLPGGSGFEPVVLGPPGAPAADHRVQALLVASDGSLWAGTQRGDLALLDAASGSQRHWLPRPPGGGEVTSLLEAPTGLVWAGRSQGLTQHALADGRLWRHLRHDPRQPDGLAANHVTALMLDRGGWLWVAGLGLGLQRHNPHNRSLWVRGADPRPDSPFHDPDTRSLLALDNGEVWAATHGSGVAVLDKGLAVIGRVPLPAGPAGSQADAAGASALPPTAEAMAQARDGSVWLASAGMLHQFDRGRRLLRSLAHGAGPARRLLARADGSLMLATGDGLHRLPPQGPPLQRLALADGSPLVGEVHALADGPDGTLWVGSTVGLLHLAPDATALTPVRSPPGASLGNPIVIGMLFDRRQTLWLDTAVAGLHRLQRWDGQLAHFDRVSERHQRLGKPFGANLLADDRGRIWTHMHVHDPKRDRVDELTATDGVAFGTGWFQANAQLADGRMLFGGSRGLLVVEPEAFEPSTFAPPLVVTELRVNGRPRPAGDLARGLVLGPEDRSFSIEFAALDYSAPQRLRYAHQLQGFDPERMTTGADFRTASYSNLAPGDYLLQVEATNRSGLWSSPVLTVPVQVLPAWWQTGWARALAALAGLAAVAGLVQLRTRQLRRAGQALEQKVQERTATLETLAHALRLESAALQESSLTDPLTGLRNRRFLALRVDDDVALALRQHQNHIEHGAALPADPDLVFFLFDIDHFKAVNDEHGHAAGDAVLVQFGQRLRSVFREVDYLLRWGGEEFLVVARQTARSQAASLAERAREAVACAPFVLDDGRPLHKTCSIGFAAFPLDPRQVHEQDWSLAVQAADAALYWVKQQGRDGWMGLVQAAAADPEQLRGLLRQPAPAWAGHAGWVVAQSSGRRAEPGD